MLSYRSVGILVFLFCAGLLGFAYYLQFAKDIEPCPLCIFQRGFFLLVGIISLIAAIHNPGKIGRWIYAILCDLSALGGLVVAGRQVWLQHLPADKVPECGPGLDYMLDAFPLAEILKKVLQGSGECAEAGWRFLSLSIAEWSLLCFIGLSLVVMLQATRRVPMVT
jgi:protein dithiol:quinone oxidoreductase